MPDFGNRYGVEEPSRSYNHPQTQSRPGDQFTDGLCVPALIPPGEPLHPDWMFRRDSNQSHDDTMSYSGQDSDFSATPPAFDSEAALEGNLRRVNSQEATSQEGNGHANNPPAPYEVVLEFASTSRDDVGSRQEDEGNDANYEGDDDEPSNQAGRGKSREEAIQSLSDDSDNDSSPGVSFIPFAEHDLHDYDENDYDDDDYESYYDDRADQREAEAQEDVADSDEDQDADEDELDELDTDAIDIVGAQNLIDRLRNRGDEGVPSGTPAASTLVAAMRHPDLSRALFPDDDSEGVMVFLPQRWSTTHRPPKDPNRFPKVPSEEGRRLMESGYFGVSDRDRRKKPLNIRLLEREMGLGTPADRYRNAKLIVQSLLPSNRADKILHFPDRVYSGQFSDDGYFFYTACQDFNVRMYDTGNPYNWKLYKTAKYPFGRWTLTDASLSPDNKFMAFTSISPMVAITPTDPADTGDAYMLNFNTGTRPWLFGQLDFGIWSIRFSGNGRELVAGTNASSIIIYDIERREVLNHFIGHEDHVNAVCFADKDAPHLIFSGSDDAVMKVWDRRSMGDTREAGAFVGHVEGLTYIDSKNDGRHILSNGKDQSMKLWDLRKALTTAQVDELDAFHTTRLTTGFDYRSGSYDEYWWDPHPHDNSLVTFRGHKVLRTLIRCHFSPPTSSNSRYVYTGSADGYVWIYNMDGTVQKKVDVQGATRDTRSPDDVEHDHFGPSSVYRWKTCVRDASWHPSATLMVASAWNMYDMGHGTLSVHSVNSDVGDEGEPLGVSYNYKLERDPRYVDSEYMAEND